MGKHLRLPTLLVIADNPSVRFWARKHLDGEFFIIDAAKKAAALEAIQFSHLDFILLDSSFEDCDPLELSKEMRQLLHNSLTPILLITGRLKKSYREKALEAGVTDFLSDQLDLEELETRIATGRKAAAVREKTIDVSSALQNQRNNLSENYLKNKLVLHDQAIRLISDAKKGNVVMTLLMLRIDRFKEMQSSMGFLLADEILLPISELLSQHLKKRDLLIPSSDGKFIALLRNMSREEAKLFAEKLRDDVQRHRFETKNGIVQLTISIAFSTIDATESSFNKMVESAIKSLSQAQSTSNLIISLEKEPQ